MIMVDGLHSVALGTDAHRFGNIFLVKLRYMGDNVTILYRQMRACSQVHNPIVSYVKGDLTINRLRLTSGYPKLKSDSSRSEEVRAFRPGASQTSS